MEPLRRLLVLLAYTLGGGIAVFCILGTFMTPFMGMSVKESLLFIPLGLFFAVLTWAIVKAIDALGDAAADYDRDGLRAVAHLGGKSGMKKFVQSKGYYNPADELGTSLQSYYDKFSAS